VRRSREQELSKPPMISIVDDDESVRESTKALVRSLGYEARAFPSAEDFLASDINETSCLILDVQMKGLSGIELQDHLIAQGRQTPIIFVTSYPDEWVRDRALSAGAVGFLGKPFSDSKLTSYLDLALSSPPRKSDQ
jgi:FixJ family two-component response regulator